MTYTLVLVESSQQWEALHDIRRSVLFEGRHADVVYDANHPDDRAAGNLPLLLTRDGEPIGTARLDDFGDGTGAIRLVAVVVSMQGQGHGRALCDRVEELARSRGIDTLYVNAAPEALGYYYALGWKPYDWSLAELIGIAADCVQMRKSLTLV